MRKLFSALLILILLLNVLGYYGVFLGLQYRNEVAMIRQFDSDSYDESRAITLKIPLTIPYMTDNTGFERVDGIFEHEGEFYRLIKQKYSKDTLTVVCVKDFENKRIAQALSSYVKTFTDEPIDQNGNSKLTVSFIKDFIGQSFAISNDSPGWQADLIRSDFNSNLVSSFADPIVHPPEQA